MLSTVTCITLDRYQVLVFLSLQLDEGNEIIGDIVSPHLKYSSRRHLKIRKADYINRFISANE